MTAVPKTPTARKITMQVGDQPEVDITEAIQDSHDIETIRTYANDIAELSEREKVAKERLGEIEAGWPEAAEVEGLQEQLTAARQKLQAKRNTSSSYVDQTEVVAAISREKAEAKEILSDYLVNHFAKTHERQVLMNEANGDAREINIKATLGKETKYQTSMDLSQG